MLVTIAAVLVALLALPAGVQAAAAGADPDQAAVDFLIERLTSPECLRRWEALQNFLGTVEEQLRRLPLLRQRVKTVDEALQERLLLLVEFLEQGRTICLKTEGLTKEVRRIAKIQDDRRRAAALDRLRQRLLRTINDPDEGFSTRAFAAAYLAFLVHKYSSELPREWSTELANLLESGDPQVRLAGSFVAAGVGFPKGQDPAKGVVIPALITGLRGASFAERYPSQRSLLRLTKLDLGQFCLDPSDPLEMRAAGVRRWEEWWNQNKDRLAPEKVGQR